MLLTYPPPLSIFEIGYDFARAATARFLTIPEAPLTKDDVILCSGGSGAIDIAMTALLDEGTNILLPKPGFSLYRTLADSKGINVKYYNLLVLTYIYISPALSLS